MWKGPDVDPDGGPDPGPPPGSSQELSDLKDQFEQQQVLIAQLKEMIRKSEQSSVTQEKVDEYMNTLSKRSGRAKKAKKDDGSGSKKIAEIPASQKISLLRQQVEQNKARLAERGKSQKGIEEMVTLLKAQLDDSQQMMSHTPLNLSLQDTKVEYSESSSAQELYTVLLMKEKKITDLSVKVHKLESNVLDLQENVKEKDSVIDARTKAITLMTENLSRKGKNTLDALDETKEQMRKMQENFISLESEMKARQMKLLDDLRLKNYEIAELQERNESLEKEITELKETEDKEENQNLTQIIAEKDAKIKELIEKTESEDAAKLKKQLDDSNKTMIKVKAQHKSKVKELTKKIDAFKKVSDANAEIVKLETENGRLNQKIAELEEEKGSMQLKMVESDSSKGSDWTERENELEAKIQDHVKELEEKDKIISILEGEISRARAEVEVLTEKLNAQVTAEMASIQFEEQMESLENEKKTIIAENENTNKELLETIETLKKEKQELGNKLDQYIQENMELVDKLEKLSAEKVSSAESIEIVENLTQQEKLELEAYQKNLDLVAGNLKSSEENLPQADLNESVNELTEETSELLQKIELFTVERREVMEKMEQLKQENNTLNLKIKEIENNRDVLAETYEQLQSEKEVLDERLASLESENETLKEKENDSQSEKDNPRENLEKLERENGELKEKLEEERAKSTILSELQAEKETLKEQLDETLNRVKDLQEELVNDKKIIEDKSLELENIQSQLEERNKELNNTIIDLTRTLSDLENDNKSQQIKITQLEEFRNNLHKQIDKHQEELESVSNAEWENRRLLESKDNEITKLMKERDNTASVILDLQKTIQDKDEKFHKISSDLKNKYLALQQQLEENSGNINNLTGPLQSKIEELTVKNKEQLDKMKKIAANLKKKTQAYQELENQLKETKERHDLELKTALQQLQDLELEVRRLQQQFDDKSEEVRNLEEKNVELQNIIADLRVKADKTNEKNLQQELLLTKENLGSVESSLRSKIQELEMIVETQESELGKARDRVLKLEEGIAYVEERRLSLERKANDLGAELEEKSFTFEEMTRSEDLLERRLNALTAHDEAIERKLQEAVTENQELSEQNKKLADKNNKLKKKIEESLARVQELEERQSAVDEVDTKNEDLKKRNHNLENELRNLQTEYERSLEESKNDFEKVNADWQVQFEEILQEKTELMMTCERFAEELKEIAEKEVDFNNELVEYKTKLEKSQAEIDNYQEQMQRLSLENEELNRAKQAIEEKEKEIQNYQQQQPPLASFFNEDPVEEPSKAEIENLNTLIEQKDEEILKLRKDREELAHCRLKIQELEQTITEFDVKKTAEVAVESVITEAEERLSPQKDIPTFVWSSPSDDPFDAFINQTHKSQEEGPPQDTTKPIENTQQELLDKIKTLEFMHFNAEKERDETHLQCQQLTNELARLLYERQNSTNLESQILQEHETRDTPDTAKELQKIEFEPTYPPRESGEAGPIVEEVVQAKEAYLCFADDRKPETIESQILTEVDIADTPETRRELHELEFEPTRSNPVQEEQCTSREAYLCFNENDDGWGWGPEEAKLEEEHALKSETTDSLQSRIRVLELERENYLEEIRQLQIKSGKLIKKLKEFKVKNEELRKKSDGGDLFNLDDTIQEELKLQIQQVEKRLKETATDLEKERNEKAAILKRIDVLTSANERMMEMKEKQDIELLGWQQNYRDLSAKLERFEWGDDGFASREPPPLPKTTNTNDDADHLNRQIQELNETIKDLTLDNEELQTLLEEQRQLRIDAEKSTISDSQLRVIEDEKRQLHEELEASIQDKNQLLNQLQLSVEQRDQFQSQFQLGVEERGQLQSQLQLSAEALSQLQNQLQTSIEERNQLENQLKTSVEERNQLQNQIQLGIDERNQLQNQLQLASEEHNQLQNQLRLIGQERDQLQNQLDSNVEDRKIIQNQVNELIKGNTDLSERFQELENQNKELAALLASKEEILKNVDNRALTIEAEKEVLFKELQEKNVQIESLQQTIDGQVVLLKTDLATQSKSAQTLIDENRLLTETISQKDAEIAKLTATMEQMAQEWEVRVDQRGSDVAESWKLHLDARETEFGQIEELLRKEINEFEEKTNALVNENNELRKNVDAEIRNEVDRVAALQQQIIDRQHTIDDLSLKLQEKQNEVEVLFAEVHRLREDKSIVDEMLKVVEEIEGGAVSRDGETFTKFIKDKQNEVIKLHQQIEEIEAATLKEVQSLKSLLQENDRSKETVNDNLQEIHKLTLLVQDKQNEIIKLHQQIEEIEAAHLKEAQSLNSLLQENDRSKETVSDNLQEIHSLTLLVQEKDQVLRQQVEELERLNALLVEKDQSLTATLSQLQEVQSLKEYANENLQNLQHNLSDYQQQLQMKNNQLEAKERETTSLKLALEEKQRASTYAVENLSQEYRVSVEEQSQEIETLRRRLLETENHYEELVSSKNFELEGVRLELTQHSQGKNQEVEGVRSELNAANEENASLVGRLNEQNSLLDEDSKQLAELKEIIEEQVLKIEELKQELFLKSSDYDSLIAEMDIGKGALKDERRQQRMEDEDYGDPANRAELDLALYMLHQRDVRCEELTVELTQLLEERDTLQLRLSNAIREKEEFLRKLQPSEVEVGSSSSSSVTRPEEAVDALDPLSTKLYELKTVGYKKDKNIVDQRELRRLQELSFIEQHREDASRLPAEAAARLVDASYTLSRDVQSPSKVLLNWLRGRSTPKVNNV